MVMSRIEWHLVDGVAVDLPNIKIRFDFLDPGWSDVVRYSPDFVRGGGMLVEGLFCRFQH